MKPALLTLFLFILITGSLSGQANRFSFPDTILKSDIPYSDNKFPDSRLNHEFNDNIDLFSGKNRSHLFDYNQDSSYREFHKIRRLPDFENDGEYPGSSRYYGKMPYLVPGFGEDSFIKIPDASAKYYLIIKDPVHHTIRK